MKVLLSIKLLIALIVTSCVQAPEPDTNASGSITEEDIGSNLNPLDESADIIILSEGLWGLNNSDLTILKEDNTILSESYLAESLNKYLGDTASDIVYFENKLYIAVTISNKIIELDLLNYTVSDVLYLPEIFRAPRAMAVHNKKLYVTDQFEDKVAIIDLSTNEMQLDNYFQTGPAPEDILIKENKIFVANSGYGDFRAGEEKSGFISCFSIEGSLLNDKFIGENLINLEAFEDKIIAGYLNTPENLKNGLKGGVKILDADNLEIIDSLELDYQRMTINQEEGKLYILTNTDVLEYNINEAFDLNRKVFSNNTNDIWYNIEYHYSSNSLYISNAKNHQINGEVLIYSLDSDTYIEKIQTGINPSDIIFPGN